MTNQIRYARFDVIYGAAGKWIDGKVGEEFLKFFSYKRVEPYVNFQL